MRLLVTHCLGLRISEVMALQWSDFDFANLTVRVQRGIVHGRVDLVKTEYSNDGLPLGKRYWTGNGQESQWPSRAPALHIAMPNCCHKLADPIYHHLRSVDAVQAKAVGVRALPLAVEVGRVRVLPANMVPVVNVLAERDHFRTLHRLPVQLLEKPVCWRTTRASLRCEEFHQHRSPGFRSSIGPMGRLRCHGEDPSPDRKKHQCNSRNSHGSRSVLVCH